MGYAATSIVMYGVAIDEKVAQSIKKQEMREDNDELFSDDTMYSHNFYRQNHAKLTPQYQQLTPITPYSEHVKGVEADVFSPKMLADDTDSRIHSLTYESGMQHYLGIYVASRGYGYQDDIIFFINHLPQEAMDNFQKVVKPLLEKYHISDTPEIHIITQTW